MASLEKVINDFDALQGLADNGHYDGIFAAGVSECVKLIGEIASNPANGSRRKMLSDVLGELAELQTVENDEDEPSRADVNTAISNLVQALKVIKNIAGNLATSDYVASASASGGGSVVASTGTGRSASSSTDKRVRDRTIKGKADAEAKRVADLLAGIIPPFNSSRIRGCQGKGYHDNELALSGRRMSSTETSAAWRALGEAGQAPYNAKAKVCIDDARAIYDTKVAANAVGGGAGGGGAGLGVDVVVGGGGKGNTGVAATKAAEPVTTSGQKRGRK